MNTKLFLLLLILSGTVYGPQNAGATSEEPPAPLPRSWYLLPEDSDLAPEVVGLFGLQTSWEEPKNQLSDDTTQILQSSLNAVERVGALTVPMQSLQGPSQHPSDWTPWRLAYFTTDLAVTVKGLIGVLGVKGTTAVENLWRKQGVAPALHTPSDGENRSSSLQVIQFQDGITEATIDSQIEPVIRAALARGEVRNGAALRENLHREVTRFFTLVQAANSTLTPSGAEWWVSGFRVELSFDASGQVHWATSMGGDIRLRLDWKRLKPKQIVSGTSTSPAQDTQKQSESGIGDSLGEFIATLRSAVEEVVREKESQDAPQGALPNFKTYSLRVGVGVTQSGNFGLVKEASSAIGQIIFSRDVKKPPVYPSQPTAQATGSDHFLMIDSHPRPSRVKFAQALGNLVSMSGTEGFSEEASYRIGKEAFKAGLRKALKISDFFAKAGGNAHSPGWKIAEIRAGFELSLTGDMGLASVGSYVTMAIGLFNMDF